MNSSMYFALCLHEFSFQQKGSELKRSTIKGVTGGITNVKVDTS